MSVALKLDTREFQQAMQEYVAATGKDSAYALNRGARNFAIKCVMSTKQSKGSAAIRALANEPWWPKMIASIVAKKSGASAGTKSYQAQWASRVRAQGIKMGKHKGAFKLDEQERSYAKEAKALSSKILRSRSSAITFLRFFFRVLAAKLSTTVKGGTVPPGKNFTGFSAEVLPAMEKKLSVRIGNAYKFKNRGAASAAGAEKELQKAMAVALPATVRDVRDYAAGQLAKQAKKYSGKGTK
jgi:hypothetical protein